MTFKRKVRYMDRAEKFKLAFLRVIQFIGYGFLLPIFIAGAILLILLPMLLGVFIADMCRLGDIGRVVLSIFAYMFVAGGSIGIAPKEETHERS